MSRPIAISIPHELGVAEAKRRLEAGFGKLEGEISGGLAQVTKSWEGDRLVFSARALGQAVSGRLEVLERSIALEVDLPQFMAAIADTITGRLKKQAKLLLEKK